MFGLVVVPESEGFVEVCPDLKALALPIEFYVIFGDKLANEQ